MEGHILPASVLPEKSSILVQHFGMAGLLLKVLFVQQVRILLKQLLNKSIQINWLSQIRVLLFVTDFD